MYISNFQKGPGSNGQFYWLKPVDSSVLCISPFPLAEEAFRPLPPTTEPGNYQLWILKGYVLVVQKQMESGYFGHSDTMAMLRDPWFPLFLGCKVYLRKGSSLSMHWHVCLKSDVLEKHCRQRRPMCLVLV